CFLVPRADWISIPLAIVANRLMTKLRFDRGIAYDIRAHYEPLDQRSAVAALWGASLPEHHTEVRDAVVSSLEEFAAKGPTDEELAGMKDRIHKEIEDTSEPHARLMGHAMAELLDGRPHGRDELLGELDPLTGPELARRVTAALKSALLL